MYPEYQLEGLGILWVKTHGIYVVLAYDRDPGGRHGLS
jgi:hypothetical protein